MEPADDEFEDARMRIYAIEDGAIRAQALAFCLRVGFFDLLEAGPRTIAEIGSALSIPARVLPALVAFLASQDLIRRDNGGHFANSPAAASFLVRSSAAYVGGRGLLFADFHEAIGHLPGSLETGLPWTPEGQHDMFGSFGEHDQRWFAEGMFANAVHGAQAILQELDLRGFRHMLDVGGSAGGYSITLLAALPRLEATIFDLPALRELAEERIEQARMGSRIRFAPGSFFEDELPKGHDLALLASILHDWSEDDCATILARCFGALEPGGQVIVAEPMLAEDLTGPEHPSVSGLTMAVLGGENRTQSAIATMLLRAGFEDAWKGSMGRQNSIVCARKPNIRS